MKRLVFTLLATVAAATGVATPALAEGFQGGRIEARGGWDSVRLDGEFDRTTPALSFDGHSSESGFGYGVEGGYDFNVGSSVVLGGYVGVDFSSADFCTTVFGGDQACLEAGRDYNVGIRAGVAAAPNLLIYVKGGYSNGKLKAEFDDFDGLVSPGVPIADFQDSKTAGGIHLGIGAEMNFGDMFYGKVEFVRTNYGNANFDATNIHLGLDATRNKVYIGAGIRF